MLKATTHASRRRLSLLVGLSTTAAIAIACAGATGSSRRAAVSLSLARAATGRGTASLSSPVISGNGDVLDLQHGNLTLGDVRLDREDGRSHGDSESDGRHDDDAVFHNGPVTVALPLDGGVVSPFTRRSERRRSVRLRRLPGALSQDASGNDIGRAHRAGATLGRRQSLARRRARAAAIPGCRPERSAGARDVPRRCRSNAAGLGRCEPRWSSGSRGSVPRWTPASGNQLIAREARPPAGAWNLASRRCVSSLSITPLLFSSGG